MKNNLTENKLEEVNDQVLAFGIDGHRCILVRADMSLSRSSMSSMSML